MGTRKNFVVPGGLTIDSTTLFVDDPNNRVGVGKTNPDHALDVAGVIKGSDGVITLTTSGEPVATLADGALAIDTSNNVFYFRSGSTWNQVSGSGASITISDSAPASPEVGDLWYNSTTGATYVRYDSYWVEVGTSGGPQGDDGQAFINADGGSASSNYGGIPAINGGAS